MSGYDDTYNNEHARDTFGHGLWTDRPDTPFTRELDQMVLVFDGGYGGSYDWDEYLVYWHTGNKRFYWISGSGCSCNSISDGVNSLGDFQDSSSIADVIKDFQSTYSGEYSGLSKSQVLDGVNELKNVKV